MPAVHHVIARSNGSNSNDSTFTPTMMKLLIALVVLIVFGMLMVGVLFIMKARRRSQKYHNPNTAGSSSNRSSSRFSHHRNLTILATPFSRNSSTTNVINEKEILIDKSDSAVSASHLPEIRITFPDEEDSSEKNQPGRVVVVKISDNGGVGLEPFHNEHLPTYQKANTESFQSLDLDSMGGLKEIEKSKP